MNYKNLLTVILYVALFIPLSCNRESEQLLESKETSNPNAVARQSKKGYDFENSKIVPLWEGIVYLKNSIEVPYTLDGKLPRPQASKGGIKNQGREKLLISNKGADFKMYIVRYISSSSFKGDINKINSENFEEQKFDGVLTIREVGEEDFETFKLRNGKIIKQTKVTKSNSKKNGRVNSSYVCVQWAQDTHWYQRLGNGELVYMYTETEYGQDCYEDGEDGGGEGNPLDCNANPNHPLCGGSGENPLGGGGVVPTLPDPADLYIPLNCNDLRDWRGETQRDMWNFYSSYLHIPYENVQSERPAGSFFPNGSSQPGSPNIRHIADPLNPDIVIDIRHFMVVGKLGSVVGNSLEVLQWAAGMPSGGNHQDYYSNALGYKFWDIYGNALANNPSAFADFLISFLSDPNNRTANTTEPSLINQRCP